VVEQLGGYNRLIATLNLLDGIKSSENAVLNRDNAIRLLYNLSEAAPMSLDLNSSDIGYKIDEETTILELNRDIYRVEGIVQANEYTGLFDDEERVSDGYVTIGEHTYLSGASEAEDFLGMYVKAFVIPSGVDDYMITYITCENSKNKSLVLDPENIEKINANFSAITYEQDTRTRTAKLENVLAVIYNGVSYGEYIAEDLIPGIGKVTLIDNDNNGKYDVVSIDDYTTMVVQAVNADTGTVANKYSYVGCLDKIVLDKANNTKYYIYDADGNEISVSDIKTNDVISIKQDRSEKIDYIRVYVAGKNTVSGTLVGKDMEENELIVDGKTYKMSADYLSFIAPDGKAISIGTTYNFYLDYFGNIAYSSVMFDNNYCMFYKAYDMEDETYTVMFMDINEKWEKLPMARKVKVDGISMKPEVAYSELSGLSPQVVKIKTNNENEVVSVDIAEVTETYDEDKFTVLGELNLYTRYQGQMRSFDCIYHIEQGSKVFIIPEDKTDIEGYRVSELLSYVAQDRQYPVSIYDRTKFNTASIYSIKEGAWSSSATNDTTQARIIVTSVSEILVDEEVKHKIEGAIGEFTKTSFFVENKDVIKGVEPGDVVAVSFSSKGYIKNLYKVCSLKSLVNQDMSNYYHVGTISGTIVDYDSEKNILIVDCGKNTYWYLNSTSTVFKYNIRANKVEVISASEMIPGNKVSFQNRYGTLNSFVYITE